MKMILLLGFAALLCVSSAEINCYKCEWFEDGVCKSEDDENQCDGPICFTAVDANGIVSFGCTEKEHCQSPDYECCDTDHCNHVGPTPPSPTTSTPSSSNSSHEQIF
ncbi:hypothetical protein lerEdw1_020903 [Lerista edwardsae]|nr:hypothetical protein lerEdw1_020903 [Lerista edwardsae]